MWAVTEVLLNVLVPVFVGVDTCQHFERVQRSKEIILVRAAKLYVLNCSELLNF